MEKIKIEQHSFTGSLWVAGWLFTIGFLHLVFWRGVLAIVLWPVLHRHDVTPVGSLRRPTRNCLRRQAVPCGFS